MELRVNPMVAEDLKTIRDYIAEHCEHGFAATEGRYYKSSNYIE